MSFLALLESLVTQDDRIAGLERDTHLQGNQFNTALAGTHSLSFKHVTST